MAQKQKMSIDEKVKIMQAYLSGKITKSEAVRRGGVMWDTMNQRIRNYEADGAEAFLPHRNRVYPLELKRESVPSMGRVAHEDGFFFSITVLSMLR